ncbi:major facilitator superfamily transporter [Fusarium albosuccineum]|uniref:Major facilitator superfamily transporter n=1 Tax=Fusarium albosuccineum TaxID=1237068 RepID=A0A8H4KZ31_9HYPO|nr:major facilitator superfamily transporter [Fusarium albosuccineum]
MEEYHISRTEATLALTLYTFGIAIGPFFIAPFSEVVGRKWIYVITSTCLLAFIGGASAANNFTTLLVCRFLAGTLGSSGVAIGAGTIADIWQLDRTGADAALLFILSPFLGPTLGPLAGAYVLKDADYDWRWTQYLILLIGGPIWICVLLMKETSKAWILRKENNLTGPVTFRRVGKIASTAVMRPTRMLFTEVVVLSLAVYAAFAYAMIFSYLSSASYVLQKYYGFNLREVGLSFISIIIGYILGIAVYMAFDHTLHDRARRASPNGVTDPEHRLYSAFVGSVCLPASLFW